LKCLFLFYNLITDTAVSTKDGHSSVLEEKDPNYNKMLGFMVGRITSKPGGRAEMGEVEVL
jgi:hypothetical protein